MSKYFDGAIKQMQHGFCMTRHSWPPLVYLKLIDGETILIHKAGGGYGLWKPTHADLLAGDWLQWENPRSKQGDLLNQDKSKPNAVPMPDHVKEAIQ